MVTKFPDKCHAFELANETLKILRCSASLVKDEEVNSALLVRIGAILFGSDIVEYKNAVSQSEVIHNLKILIGQISFIIDTPLKHIDPQAVYYGEVSAINDLVEIIHSFVTYCAKANLLDFEASTCISSNHTECLEIPTSPEVPRSAGRSCIKRHSYIQTNNDSSSSLIARDDSVYPVTAPNGSSHATRHWHLSRLHSSHSPPATPQAIDEILELEKDQSPTPSRSSPIFLPFTEEYNQNGLVKLIPARFPAVDDYQWNEPAVLASALSSSYRHKISGSSSGRGHSPTTWITAAPPQASSAQRPCDAQHAIADDNDIDSLAGSRGCLASDAVQTSVCSDGTTSSRPPRTTGASTERHDRREEDESARCRVHDHLRQWECPYGSAVSSASVLLARTEGFSRAVNRRLSHLRSVPKSVLRQCLSLIIYYEQKPNEQ